MARDQAQSSSHQLYQQHGKTVVRQPKLLSKPPQCGQRPSQIGDDARTRVSIPADILQRLSQDNPMIWKIEFQEPSGMLLGASSEQPVLKEIRSQNINSSFNRPTSYNSSVKNELFDDRIFKSSALNRTLTGNEKTFGSSIGGFDNSAVACNGKKRSHATSNVNHVMKRPKASDFDESKACIQGEMLDPDDVPDEPEEELPGSKKVISIRVDEIRPYLRTMSHMIQQKGIKKILVTWLKRGHPKKQANFPYNGGLSPESRPGYDNLNPGKDTAPPYWPKQDDWRNPKSNCCRHKEPDHVKKWERQYLFVHLLCNIGDGFKEYHFDVDSLEDSTKDIVENNSKHFPDGAEDILRSVYHARRVDQRFQDGGVDGDSLINITVFEKRRLQAPQHIGASLLVGIPRTKREASDNDAATQIEYLRPTSPTSVDSTCSATIKSERSAENDSEREVGSFDATLSTHTSLGSTYLPSTASYCPANDKLSSICLPFSQAPDTDKDKYAKASSFSNHPTESGSLDSTKLMFLAPTPKAMSRDVASGMETCMNVSRTHFPQELFKLPSSHHRMSELPDQCEMQQQDCNGLISELAQIQQQAQVEIRPKPARTFYPSSGVPSVLTTDQISTQVPSSSTSSSADYSSTTGVSTESSSCQSVKVSDHDTIVPSDRDYLFNQGWFPTFLDLDPTMTMSGSNYNVDTVSKLIAPETQVNQLTSNALIEGYPGAYQSSDIAHN